MVKVLLPLRDLELEGWGGGGGRRDRDTEDRINSKPSILGSNKGATTQGLGEGSLFHAPKVWEVQLPQL